MKKLLLFVLTFFGFTSLAFAETPSYKSDKLTISNLDVNVVLIDSSYYRITEKYATKLIFGDLPGTYFFAKNIFLNRSVYYNSKKVNYVTKLKSYNITSDIPYYIDIYDKNNVRFKFGDKYNLLDEEENIALDYDLDYSGSGLKTNSEFNYVLAENDYDTDKITFSIMFPEKITKSEGYISFSLNNKDFSSKIDGLSYKMHDGFYLTGSYDKVLKAGKALSARIVFKESILNNINSKSIVYGSLILGSLSVVIIFSILLRHKRRKMLLK